MIKKILSFYLRFLTSCGIFEFCHFFMILWGLEIAWFGKCFGFWSFQGSIFRCGEWLLWIRGFGKVTPGCREGCVDLCSWIFEFLNRGLSALCGYLLPYWIAFGRGLFGNLKIRLYLIKKSSWYLISQKLCIDKTKLPFSTNIKLSLRLYCIIVKSSK